jgi:hypothetical protein
MLDVSICGTAVCRWYFSRKTSLALLAGTMQVRVLLLPVLSCGRASRSWTTQAGGSAAVH